MVIFDLERTGDRGRGVFAVKDSKAEDRDRSTVRGRASGWSRNVQADAQVAVVLNRQALIIGPEEVNFSPVGSNQTRFDSAIQRGRSRGGREISLSVNRVTVLGAPVCLARESDLVAFENLNRGQEVWDDCWAGGVQDRERGGISVAHAHHRGDFFCSAKVGTLVLIDGSGLSCTALIEVTSEARGVDSSSSRGGATGS